MLDSGYYYYYCRIPRVRAAAHGLALAVAPPHAPGGERCHGSSQWSAAECLRATPGLRGQPSITQCSIMYCIMNFKTVQYKYTQTINQSVDILMNIHNA